MFLPNKMSKVDILVFSKYLGALTEAIGKSGILHLTNASGESKFRQLKQMDTGRDVKAIEQQLNRCAVLLEALGIDEETEPPEVSKLSAEEITELFEKVDKLYRERTAEISKLVEERAGVQQTTASLSLFPFQNLKAESLRNLSQLHLEIGELDEEAFLRARQTLQDEAILVRSEGNARLVLVLTSRKKRFAVDDILDKFHFRRQELPDIESGSVAEKRVELKDHLEELHRRLNEAKLGVVALADEYGGLLLAIRQQLHGLLAIRQAQGFFGKSRQLFCISGWLPSQELGRLQRIVDATTESTGIVEALDADSAELTEEERADIPVQFSPSPLVKPFQLLVANYGIPNYHELDPSLFFGITFVIMFGYMFGDVGQGAVLAAAGIYMRHAKRFADDIRAAGSLLLYCGTSAIAFGFLYGSVFGSEEILPHLWLSPLATGDIFRLLKTAVCIGVVFLSVALIINIINHFRAKRYLEGTFDKYGLLGIAFYWACLLTALHATATGRVAPWQWALIITPLALLFLHRPVLNLLRDHSVGGKEGSAVSVLTEGAIEIMETFSGYLSGTVSFVRVGAFAISHAALCFAVYTVMHLFDNLPGSLAVKFIVAVLGNLLIIAFEGMVAAIQCVRLEYYEMFSRFFQGGGKEFKPFKL